MSQILRFMDAGYEDAAPYGIADYTMMRPDPPTPILTGASWEILPGKGLHQRGEHSLNSIYPDDDPPSRLTLYDSTKPPTFASNYLTTYDAETSFTGLLTPSLEADEETYYIVCQIANGTPNMAILGTLASAGAETPDKGWMLYRATGGATYRVLTRGITTASGTVLNITLPAGLSAGAWAFIGVAHTLTGTAQRRVFVGGSSVGGGPADYTSTVNGTKVLSARNVAVGSVHFQASYADKLSVAYVGRFASAKSLVDMAADYATVQTALAARSVTVF